MQKALTFMNLQLHPVVSDMTGATGMRMIRAIVGRERNPQVLARMRDDRCKASEHTVQSARVGNDQPEHVCALKQALNSMSSIKLASRNAMRKLSRRWPPSPLKSRSL